MYTVYYIEKHPKDGQPYVGCTNDINRRMSKGFSGHNVPLSDVKILYQTEYIIVASMMEQQEQELLLGKSDGYFYHKYQTKEINDARIKNMSVAISAALSGENHPMYGKTHSDETRAKMSEAHSGLIHSEETKAKMSASQLGHSKSEETKAKMSGKVALNNGTTEVRVRPELVEDYLSQGFTRGRLRSNYA